MTRKPKGPSEAQIQQACDDFLALDGWRKIVTDPPHMRGLGVSEKGIPDRIYIRYEGNAYREGLRPLPVGDVLIVRAEVLWVEHKKRGGKSAQHQKAWHAAERARGALVWLAGEEFPATIEGFQAHYMASGLNRRIAQPKLKKQLGSKHNAT